MIRKLAILLLGILPITIQLAGGQIYFDGNVAVLKEVGAGGILRFAAGNLKYLLIKNFKGKDSDIISQHVASDTPLTNYLVQNVNLGGFVSLNMRLPNDFKLKRNSPLIDATDTNNTIGFDLSGILRLYGTQTDIGAFKNDGSTFNMIQPQNTGRKSRLLQNPVKDKLKINIQQKFGSDVYLEIFNLQGVCVLQQSGIKLKKRITEVNISNLVPGIYIYLICSEKLSESGKFVTL